MAADPTSIERGRANLTRLGGYEGLRDIAPIGIAFVAALVLGLAASEGRTIVAAPFVAAAVIALFARSPQLPFLAVVVLASTFADAYALPKAGPLYLPEAVMFLGLATLPFFRSTAPGGIVGAAVAGFLAAVMVGVVVATGHGVAVHDALLEARTPVLYTSFWLALSAARADRSRFLTLVGGAAVAVAVLSIAQFLLPGHVLFRTGQLPVLTSDNGFLRVRPPGLLLAYFGSIFGLAYFFWGGKQRRFRALLLVALFATAILISLNRNMIVGISVGLVTAFLLLPRRTQAGIRIVAAAVAAVALVTVAGHGTVVERILSLGNRSYLQQTTLADRAYEDVFARATIGRHPLSGVGFGVAYGAQARTASGVIQPRAFVHNQYYELWLKTGLLGLLAFVASLAATAARAFRIARHGAEEDRWVGAAALACVVAFAASSFVGIYVFDAGSTPAVVALLALVCAWPLPPRKLGSASREPEMKPETVTELDAVRRSRAWSGQLANEVRGGPDEAEG
jgi:O-antigen ligase